MDASRFNNHAGMIKELVAEDYNYMYLKFISEAELVHLYDITFLANKWQFADESRQYRPSGVRITSGPYKGRFPNA